MWVLREGVIFFLSKKIKGKRKRKKGQEAGSWSTRLYNLVDQEDSLLFNGTTSGLDNMIEVLAVLLPKKAWTTTPYKSLQAKGLRPCLALHDCSKISL
jgi:hypothetical protein